VAVQKPESSKELSEEEKKKIDEDVRRTWADMKKALSGGRTTGNTLSSKRS